ncbi:MAG: hypothetical protein NUV47_03880 [Patescibacteria group bacterium]|nr:hypothetical protein [Patescibacteria group bacterium]
MNTPKKFILIILPVLTFTFVFYAFLVRQTIVNVITREKVEKEANDILSSISDLETQYMNAKGSINLDMAYAQGFKNADSTIFITRGGLGQADQPNHIQ